MPLYRKACQGGTSHFGSGLMVWWNSQKSIWNHTGMMGKETAEGFCSVLKDSKWEGTRTRHNFYLFFKFFFINVSLPLFLEPSWALWTSSKLRICSCLNPTVPSSCALVILKLEELQLPGWQKILTKQVKHAKHKISPFLFFKPHCSSDGPLSNKHRSHREIKESHSVFLLLLFFSQVKEWFGTSCPTQPKTLPFALWLTASVISTTFYSSTLTDPRMRFSPNTTLRLSVSVLLSTLLLSNLNLTAAKPSLLNDDHIEPLLILSPCACLFQS